MKSFIYPFCFLILLSCNSGNSTTKQFIPGIYVREVSNEFSLGHDTLFIKAIKGGLYVIDHNASYQRIKDGQFLAVESKKEKWLANYNNAENVLVETRMGKIISFRPDSYLLFVGSSPYQKIIQ